MKTAWSLGWAGAAVLTACVLGCQPGGASSGVASSGVASVDSPTPVQLSPPVVAQNPGQPPASHPAYSPENPTGLPPGLSQLSAPVWSYRVINRYPHDVHAFTEGLLVSPRGTLYESVGQYKDSAVREVELVTGKVLRQQKLADDVFGEGLTELGDHLYQLSWQNHRGFIYQAKSLKPSGSFRYDGEGWGLTLNHKRQFVMSNGSSRISIRDSKNFGKIGEFEVLDGVHPVVYLNELEMLGDDLLANVWTTDYLAVIDTKDGHVKAWIDLGGLLSQSARSQADVLNGIAYDARQHKLYVTGKYWPTLFEIEIVKH